MTAFLFQLENVGWAEQSEAQHRTEVLLGFVGFCCTQPNLHCYPKKNPITLPTF